MVCSPMRIYNLPHCSESTVVYYPLNVKVHWFACCTSAYLHEPSFRCDTTNLEQRRSMGLLGPSLKLWHM